MSLHSVEALLDDAVTAEVRREWELLAAAGLPSQAGHTGPTNAPHVTLSAASAVPDVVDRGLSEGLAGHLPLSVRLGGLVVLGSRRWVLARLVVPDAGLLALHGAVAEVMAACPDVPEHVRPGRWTPHVTLARGLGSRQVGEALAVLGRTRTLDGAVASVRRWDPDAGRAWEVAGARAG